MASDDRRNRIEIGLATLIGVLALAVSGWSAYWQRAQARAQTWPHVELDFSDLPNFQMRIANVGVGPAMIKTVEVTVDGKACTDWRDVVHRLGVTVKAGTIYTGSMGGHVMGPGAQYATMDLRDADAGPRVHELADRIGFSICYCSVLDECWRLRGTGTKSVRSCNGEPDTWKD